MSGDQQVGDDAPTSHYDRLGGAPTIHEAVERFYSLVLGDPDLAPFFTDTDVAKVKRHQVLLLSQVLGGPANYDGRALGQAHRGMGITESHYDKVVAHLVRVLIDLGADDDVIAAAGAVVSSVRRDIVGSAVTGPSA